MHNLEVLSNYLYTNDLLEQINSIDKSMIVLVLHRNRHWPCTDSAYSNQIRLSKLHRNRIFKKILCKYDDNFKNIIFDFGCRY